jgi:hypothetical protein
MAPTLTSEAWAQIRFDYEHSERPIAEICAEHGISSGTLRDRMRRWGWSRRRPPIPREGPQSLPAPVVEMPPVAGAATLAAACGCNASQSMTALHTGSPHPAASRSKAYADDASLPAPLGGDPAHEGEDQGGEAAAPAPQDSAPGAVHDAPSPPAAADEDTAPLAFDDGALTVRLEGAVARLLPAIEAIVAKLAAGTTQPREMEHAGRALGALTRTLRELNALLSERTPPADTPARKPDGDESDEGPRDLEAFRIELTRRMNAIVEAREAAEAVRGAAGEASPPSEAAVEHEAPSSSSDPMSESAARRGPHERSI